MTAATDLAIVDSGGANISSVRHALARLDVTGELTQDPDLISKAKRVILPGVGAAADAMKRLCDAGLIECLQTLSQPVLGICLGMQLLFDHSEEGDVDMLGVVAGDVAHFKNTSGLTVPHMGWNNIKDIDSRHPLLKGLHSDSYFYFVHSYRAPVTKDTIAACEYGDVFTAIAARDNFMGCQFHPERSSRDGATIFKNFLQL